MWLFLTFIWALTLRRECYFSLPPLPPGSKSFVGFWKRKRNPPPVAPFATTRQRRILSLRSWGSILISNILTSDYTWDQKCIVVTPYHWDIPPNNPYRWFVIVVVLYWLEPLITEVDHRPHHRDREEAPRSSNQLFQTNPLFSSSYSAFVIDKCIVTEFLVIYTGIDLSLFSIKPRRNGHFYGRWTVIVIDMYHR